MLSAIADITSRVGFYAPSSDTCRFSIKEHFHTYLLSRNGKKSCYLTDSRRQSASSRNIKLLFKLSRLQKFNDYNQNNILFYSVCISLVCYAFHVSASEFKSDPFIFMH